MASCSPQSLPQVVASPVKEVSSHDSVGKTVNYLVNNRYIRDSIYIRERGDTVYLDRWHIERHDSIVLTHDTIRVAHTDTVPVVHIQEVIREVPTPIPRDKTLIRNGILRFYRYCMWFTVLCIVCILLYIVKRLYLR